jgi:hypothetical protein
MRGNDVRPNTYPLIVRMNSARSATRESYLKHERNAVVVCVETVS